MPAIGGGGGECPGMAMGVALRMGAPGGGPYCTELGWKGGATPKRGLEDDEEEVVVRVEEEEVDEEGVGVVALLEEEGVTAAVWDTTGGGAVGGHTPGKEPL